MNLFVNKINKNRTPVVLLSLFFALAIFASAKPYFGIDLLLSHTIQSFDKQKLYFFMNAISLLGNFSYMPIFIIMVFSSLYFLNLKTAATVSLISIVSSIFANGVIKAIINRPRPSESLVHVYSNLIDKSFPSGHTMTYTLVFGFLIFIASSKIKNKQAKKYLVFLLSLPILTIGISRIYLGAHWASDVLGGYLLGSFWLYCSIKYYQHLELLHIS